MTGDEELHRPSTTVLLTPDTSTVSGTVHGGQLLELLHQVASTCASRYGRNHAATPGGDQVVVTMRPRRGPQARRREVEQRAEEIRAGERPPPGAALTALAVVVLTLTWWPPTRPATVVGITVLAALAPWVGLALPAPPVTQARRRGAPSSSHRPIRTGRG